MEERYSENTVETEEQEKMKMSDCFITAMFLPKEYNKLLKLKTGKIIGYLFLLMLLTTVIQYAIPTLGAIAGLGGMKGIIMNEIPEFAFKDGTFSFGEKLEQLDEEIQSYYLIDTSVERFTEEDVPKNMMEAILVSKTNILIYNNITGLGGGVQEQLFENYKNITITNATVAKHTLLIYMFLFLIFLVAYGISFVKYLLMALFYAAILYLMTRTMMLQNTFGRMYKMALFAQTIGAIVEAVAICLNSALLILAGNVFHVLITVYIMNKVLIQKQKDTVI